LTKHFFLCIMLTNTWRKECSN